MRFGQTVNSNENIAQLQKRILLSYFDKCCSLRYNSYAEKGKEPRIKCVICGLSNAVYKRPDGVFVIPITALKN